MKPEDTLTKLIEGCSELTEIEPHIYSVASERGLANVYDEIPGFYDLVMGNRFYNRLMWGYWPAEFVPFCGEALRSSSQGAVLDAGCGSLVFTAETYAAYSDRPVVLADQSLAMLRGAKKRLIEICGAVPGNMVFLHGDALELPFRPQEFKTIVAMNLLHVIEDPHALLDGFKGLLQPGGAMFFTTLVLNNRFGDKYMRMLSHKGMIIPRTADQVVACFERAGIPVSAASTGNMLFVGPG